MRLIITGCEYSGTTTLSFELAKWGKKRFIENGKEETGWELNAFHDHWKIPHVMNFWYIVGLNILQYIAFLHLHQQ